MFHDLRTPKPGDFARGCKEGVQRGKTCGLIAHSVNWCNQSFSWGYVFLDQQFSRWLRLMLKWLEQTGIVCVGGIAPGNPSPAVHVHLPHEPSIKSRPKCKQFGSHYATRYATHKERFHVMAACQASRNMPRAANVHLPSAHHICCPMPTKWLPTTQEEC